MSKRFPFFVNTAIREFTVWTMWSGPTAIERQHGNLERPADARQQDNGGPGPTAARSPKREIGCADPRRRLRGTQRGRGVVGLVTRRDSASLRRTADGSQRDLSSLLLANALSGMGVWPPGNPNTGTDRSPVS